MKQKRKGFTLVELIVVIAIIGILAAVLIPTFSGAIESARFANDQAAARNMSTIVKQYCMMNGVDEEDLQAPDIRYIINTEEEFYTFRPASSEGVFWYNRNTGNVEVTRGVVPVGGTAVSAAEPRDSIEEVLPGQIYLNTEGELANFLKGLRHITGKTEYDSLAPDEALDGVSIATLTSIYEAYNPDNTLFIGTGEKGYYTTATGVDVEGNAKTVKKVVFADGIQVLSGTPALLEAAEDLNVQLPITVVVVEEQNPLNLLTGAKITTTASNQKVAVEGTAFSSLEVSSQLSHPIDAESFAARVAKGNSFIKVIPKAIPAKGASQSNYHTDSEMGYYALPMTESTGAQVKRLTIGTLGKTAASENFIKEIITKDLMEAYPSIHTLSIVYRPTISAEGGFPTMDVRIIALDNEGKIADLIVTAAHPSAEIPEVTGA